MEVLDRLKVLDEIVEFGQSSHSASSHSGKYRVDQKKVNFVLDQLERCGFLHGVQHVSKSTSIVILDIASFDLFCCLF